MLRDYQQDVDEKITQAIAAGNRHVLAVEPCGAGKTVNMAHLVGKYQVCSLSIAHRQELVGQISCTMASQGIPHRIIAPDNVIGPIVEKHVGLFGASFYQPRSPYGVAGIDTMIRRDDPFFNQVRLWQMDEAHHVLAANKWGRGIAMLPNAVGVGWTATPIRSDRRGLGRKSHGVFDVIVLGPSVTLLMERGYLARYKIFAPRGDMDLSHVSVTAAGDYNPQELGDAAEKSHIVGDVVQQYLKIAAGKLGVTFAVNERIAHEHVAAYQQAGVPAAFIGYKTKNRDQIIDAYKRQDIKQLVNMDILGEGFDCPAMEVCTIAAPTLSYARWIQRFFRPLRPQDGKAHGIIIDHVDNWRTMIEMGYGLPDSPQQWTLEPSGKRTVDPLAMPVRACLNPQCFRTFEGWSKQCPYCGHRPTAQAREMDDIEVVDGDLTEISPDVLDRLRKQAEKLIEPLPKGAEWRMNQFAQAGHIERADAQIKLRTVMSWWAGVRADLHGEDMSTSCIRFFKTFGIDAASAQILSGPKAKELHARIWENLHADSAVTWMPSNQAQGITQ